MDTPSIANILVSLDGEEIEIAGSMRGLIPSTSGDESFDSIRFAWNRYVGLDEVI